MKYLPKSFSKITTWGGVIFLSIIILLTVGPGGGHLKAFILLLFGPFSYLTLITGVEGWVPPNPYQTTWGNIQVIGFSLLFGFLGLLTILSHSYWPKTWAIFLTIFGYLFWLFCGLGITFITV
jgi:hypothetical protein